MLLEAIFHEAKGSYAYPISETQLRVRLRAKKGDVVRCEVLYADRYASPEEELAHALAGKAGSDERFDYFEALLECSTKRVKYVFLLTGPQGEAVYFGETGFSAERSKAGVFQYAYIHRSEVFTTPEWAKEAVIYQIFPERFANGDPSNDPPGTEQWAKDARPRHDSFYGGDLKGVIDRLPYLEELGVTALYFTPIFASPSHHKYDTADYLAIDPQFGDLPTFRRLVDEAHRRGIKIILDAVFNHAGDQFFAFRDVLQKGEQSRYKDWFFIEDFPVSKTSRTNYETFAVQVPAMPKLRTENPEVKEYLFDVARFWMEQGIDGWRLDVANEVDHAFWREFRRLVKSLNPDALIVGEIWHDASGWLMGDQFDSVMNYLFRESVIRFFATGEIHAERFDAELTRARMLYPEQAAQGLWNLLDSHDTERFLTSCGGNEAKFRLAVLFQMTYLGTPLIYYGDEIGMAGATDPDCLRPMIWEEKEQNRGLFEFYKELIRLRHRLASLTRGNVRSWHADKQANLYAFVRTVQDQHVGVVLNNRGEKQTVLLQVPESGGKTWLDCLTGEEVHGKQGQLKLTLRPYQGMILWNGR
uniref:Alpha-amylase II n=1 Tax=Thermoactinomyces vulgaris TaxID=2026 RepID=UPI00004EC037|nr:Chain A, Alpha-amylase II [Thermoactinomyces vulgaris]1WZL_B Chain B, Alpha-amylase II [Thermoactinomyces vulgaris]